jgi:hypothetical protein
MRIVEDRSSSNGEATRRTLKVVAILSRVDLFGLAANTANASRPTKSLKGKTALIIRVVPFD